MSNAEKSKHWESLAANLGAESPPDPVTSDQHPPPNSSGSDIEPVHEATPAPPSARPPRPRREPPAKTDWGELADTLGVQVAPESSEAEETPSTDRDSANVLPDPTGDLREPDESPCTAEASQHASSDYATIEQYDVGTTGFLDEVDLDIDAEPMGDADESVGEAIEEGSVVESGGEGDKRPRRRRRRRGRRLRKTITTESTEQQEDDQTETPPDVQGEAAEDVQEEPEESAGDVTDRPKRSGRRRRRRSGPKVSDKRAAVGEDTDDLPALGAAGGNVSETDEASSEETTLFAEAKCATDGGQATESTAGKISHRRIPSWQEAIGTIITANLESRSKPAREEGSRGRGRGRGHKSSPKRG